MSMVPESGRYDHQEAHWQRVLVPVPAAILGPLLVVLSFFLPWVAPPWMSNDTYSGWQWLTVNLGLAQQGDGTMRLTLAALVVIPLVMAIIMALIALLSQHPSVGAIRAYRILGAVGLTLVCLIIVAHLFSVISPPGPIGHDVAPPVLLGVQAIGIGGWLSIAGFVGALLGARATAHASRAAI